MPMLLVSDEVFSKEVAKLAEPKKEVVTQPFDNIKVVDIKHGRPTGRLEIPASIRMIAAEEALNGTAAKTIANALGISESSVSAYKNDATSTTSYDKPNEELKKSNDTVREKITTGARSKLMMALDAITEENISSAKVKDIASIAKDMSVVMKNIEPAGPLVQNNQQVIIYRPRARDEDEFETITVNE